VSLAKTLTISFLLGKMRVGSRLKLFRVRPRQVDFLDGWERVSSQTLSDLFDVPNAADGRHVSSLANVRAELGWTSVRVRDLTRGGYKEQVRGYCGPAQKKTQ
jgi:hypothetical protein